MHWCLSTVQSRVHTSSLLHFVLYGQGMTGIGLHWQSWSGSKKKWPRFMMWGALSMGRWWSKDLMTIVHFRGNARMEFENKCCKANLGVTIHRLVPAIVVRIPQLHSNHLSCTQKRMSGSEHLPCEAEGKASEHRPFSSVPDKGQQRFSCYNSLAIRIACKLNYAYMQFTKACICLWFSM